MSTILHVNSNYLVSKLHENLVDGLNEYGYKQLIFMPIKKEILKEVVYESKYKVHHPISFYNRDKYAFFWKQHKVMNKLKESIDLEEVDFVHAHSLFTDGNVAYSLYNKEGIPYVVTVREFTDMDFFKKRMNLRQRGKEIIRNAEHIIFLSKKSKEAFQNSYLKDIWRIIEDKVTVVPNGIDTYWFDNEYKSRQLSESKKIRFIFAGRIMKSKNIPLIISSLKKINEETIWMPELTIVGNVKDRSAMRKLDKSPGFPVAYKDRLSREDLMKEYRTHDLFIMPSFRESFGLVYAEALSQGLPIIYSKASGFYKQFEEGKVGYGVDPKSLEDTFRKIIKTIESYDSLSVNAIKAYKCFSWETVSEKYDSIYRTLEENMEK